MTPPHTDGSIVFATWRQCARPSSTLQSAFTPYQCYPLLSHIAESPLHKPGTHCRLTLDLVTPLRNTSKHTCSDTLNFFALPNIQAPSSQHRKVWLTPAAGVPYSDAANIGERKTWTQSEFFTWQNSVRGKSHRKCI